VRGRPGWLMRVGPSGPPAGAWRAGGGALAAGRLACAALGALVLASGCGATRAPRRGPSIPANLASQARPLGRGAAFHPPVRGRVIGACSRRLGVRDAVHVELFAANRVVLIPAGIGTAAPRTMANGRVLRARCYGELVTLDPTGLVLVRPGSRLRLSDLFGSWGQPLSERRLGPFSATAGARVAVFVDGRARRGPPQDLPLRRHAEIVLEVGPHVPPHASYAFPPGA
jgi:hypothetical protein